MQINKINRRCIITTSWDDGHPLDLELAKLLRKYKIKGTFYIPLKNGEREVMSENELKTLAKNFEIGFHTISHKVLTSLSLEDAKKEIIEGKKILENMLNMKIEMFSYPKGRYNYQILNLVKQAGFIGARTTECFRVSKPKDFYRMWTTIHVHPNSIRKNIGNIIMYKSIKNFKGVFLVMKNINKSWVDLAKTFFDYAYKSGGIFHIWGHSWEIEKLGLWEELEEVLAYISERKVISLSNSEVVRVHISIKL